MHPRRPSVKDEEGSAALEFITVGVILLVPLVYLVVALGTIQEQTLGVEAAARHTARLLSLASDETADGSDATRILEGVAEQYGIDSADMTVSITCVPAGASCPSAGATVTVRVRTSVRLPLVPSVLGLDTSSSIPVEGVSVQKVSRAWRAP